MIESMYVYPAHKCWNATIAFWYISAGQMIDFDDLNLTFMRISCLAELKMKKNHNLEANIYHASHERTLGKQLAN